MASATGPMAQATSLSHDRVDDSPEDHLNGHTSTTSTFPEDKELAENPTNSTKLRPSRTSHRLQNTRSALGLHPLAPVDEEHDYGPRSELLWSRIRTVLREPFAEFWGVAIMVMFGCGSVAQVLLSTGETGAPGGNGFGAYQSINWG